MTLVDGLRFQNALGGASTVQKIAARLSARRRLGRFLSESGRRLDYSVRLLATRPGHPGTVNRVYR
jgi:hypothetical protein